MHGEFEKSSPTTIFRPPKTEIRSRLEKMTLNNQNFMKKKFNRNFILLTLLTIFQIEFDQIGSFLKR